VKHFILTYGPYVATFAVLVWWHTRNERSKRTDIPEFLPMCGEFPDDGLPLSLWEEERWEDLEARLTSPEPAGQPWFPVIDDGRQQ